MKHFFAMTAVTVATMMLGTLAYAAPAPAANIGLTSDVGWTVGAYEPDFGTVTVDIGGPDFAVTGAAAHQSVGVGAGLLEVKDQTTRAVIKADIMTNGKPDKLVPGTLVTGYQASYDAMPLGNGHVRFTLIISSRKLLDMPVMHHVDLPDVGRVDYANVVDLAYGKSQTLTLTEHGKVTGTITVRAVAPAKTTHT
jgi:hypothetical protein